jgi:uncharacterized protein (DUF433 family)
MLFKELAFLGAVLTTSILIRASRWFKSTQAHQKSPVNTRFFSLSRFRGLPLKTILPNICQNYGKALLPSISVFRTVMFDECCSQPTAFKALQPPFSTIGGSRRLFPVLLRLKRSTVGTRRLSVLGPSILSKLNKQVRKMALDWSQCPAVESIPGKVSGAWVLRGTRMPVSVIFENLEAGANIDDIMNWFEGLDRSKVKAVIEFAARSLDETPSSAGR